MAHTFRCSLMMHNRDIMNAFIVYQTGFNLESPKAVV